MVKQFEKGLILRSYPKKVPIWGAHGDINRMLRDRGLDEIYLESDEMHHGHTRDEYQQALKAVTITPRSKEPASLRDSPGKAGKQIVFQAILASIQAKIDEGKDLSMKDSLFRQIATELKALALVDEHGKVKPLASRQVIGDMEFVNFEAYPAVGNNERWMNVYAPMLNSPQDTPNLSPIGSAIGLEKIHSLAKDIAEEMKVIDQDLYWFESSELYDEDLFRGIYEPVMLLTRVVQWNQKYYQREPVPKWALPPCPHGSLKVIKLGEVEIENIHANVGFHRLVRLVEKGKLLADSQLYLDLLLEAQEYMAKLSVPQILGPAVLLSVTPPHAVGKRNQGLGRAIIMVAKKIFLVESTWAQPLQDYLEEQDWYAGGDRLTRLKRMTKVLLGKPGSHLVDGDDFIIKLRDGTVVAGDYSSYESSVRDIDHVLVWDWIVRAFTGLSKYLVYNLGRACGFADLVTGIGVAKRSPLHGIDSGRATTHTEESILNSATLRAASWSSLDALVGSLTKMGRIMRKSAQYVCKSWVFLAKLACNGKVIFGSAVRALWGICMPEDPPGLDFEKGPDLFWSSRTVAILSNIVDNPLYNKVLSIIMSAYGSELVKMIRSTSASSIKQAALDKVDKTRRLGRMKKRGGIIERKNIDLALRSILTYKLKVSA